MTEGNNCEEQRRQHQLGLPRGAREGGMFAAAVGGRRAHQVAQPAVHVAAAARLHIERCEGGDGGGPAAWAGAKGLPHAAGLQGACTHTLLRRRSVHRHAPQPDASPCTGADAAPTCTAVVLVVLVPHAVHVVKLGVPANRGDRIAGWERSTLQSLVHAPCGIRLQNVAPSGKAPPLPPPPASHQRRWVTWCSTKPRRPRLQ